MSSSWEGFLTAFCYFLPTIVAFLRNVPGKWFVFVINLLTGITVVGWFVSWVFVFPRLQRGFQRSIVAISGAGAQTGPASRAQNFAGSGSDAPQQRDCPNGTDGRMTCPQCGGMGWAEMWVPPTTADGVAQLERVRCPLCLTSGRVQCTVCGGTGHVW